MKLIVFDCDSTLATIEGIEELADGANAEVRTRIAELTNEAMEALKAYIEKGKTYCFLGSSGVGKSSLINKLIGTDEECERLNGKPVTVTQHQEVKNISSKF